jgi:ATP-binding cassette subfamily A (ABC1) protein 3
VEGVKLNPQSAEDSLIFTLPFTSKVNLISTFGDLERIPSIQFDLKLNTLEEAFINIGMDEEAFISKTRKYS